jgi:hypothetical protein
LIFVDSNIPMCPIGAVHPHKTDAQIILDRLTDCMPFDEPYFALTGSVFSRADPGTAMR